MATHRPDSLGWENSQWLGKDPVAALRDLRQGDGPVLLIQGSSVLIHALLAHDLIDEIRLIVAPLMLGKGKRLFDDGTMPRSLKLVKSGTTQRGTLLVNYERGRRGEDRHLRHRLAVGSGIETPSGDPRVGAPRGLTLPWRRS